MSEWREIPGLPGFEVTADARVRRRITLYKTMMPLPAAKPVPVRLGHNGYLKFTHIRDGKTGTTDLHRAVGLAWLGPAPTPKHHVDHVDGDRTNCCGDNLRWASASENQKNKKPRRITAEITARVQWSRVIERKSYGQIAREFDIDHRMARRYANAPA